MVTGYRNVCSIYLGELFAPLPRSIQRYNMFSNKLSLAVITFKIRSKLAIV